MKVYVGEPAGKTLELCKKKGIGAVITPHKKTRYYPYKFPFFFVDNGAFGWWNRGESFNEKEFFKLLEKIENFYPQVPDFVVIPDKVAEGISSVEFSISYYEKLKELPYKLAFVVQNGMNEELVKEVLKELPKVKVLFVGGTLPWKLQSLPVWAKVAKELSLSLHVGRMGTEGRVTFARLTQVSSIDSSLPLFSKSKLQRFLQALESPVLPLQIRR